MLVIFLLSSWIQQHFHNKMKVLSLFVTKPLTFTQISACFFCFAYLYFLYQKLCICSVTKQKTMLLYIYNLRTLVCYFCKKNDCLWEYFSLAHHIISNRIICGFQIFLSDPFDCLYFLPFHLLSWNSCLMRRSKTAKRMNRAEWVPEVQICPCASVLWLAVFVIIRKN